MNQRISAQTTRPAPLNSVAAPRPFLQRKCVCANSPGPAKEYEEFDHSGLSLQRSTPAAKLETREPEGVPPIVHEVLRSPGQPLDAATRAFFEPRFGHDFGHVRVHTDARAAESARAVNALAYTVGHDVVFGGGRYSPGTKHGERLLAHELTHVAQQQGSAVASQSLALGSPFDPAEREAESTARDFPGRFSLPLSVSPIAVMRDPDEGQVRLETGEPLPGVRPPGYEEDRAQYTQADYYQMLARLRERCNMNTSNLARFFGALREGWIETLLSTRLEVLTEPAGLSLLSTSIVTVFLGVIGTRLPNTLNILIDLVFNVISDALEEGEIAARVPVLEAGFRRIEPNDPGDRGLIASALTEISEYQVWLDEHSRGGGQDLRLFRIPLEVPEVNPEQVKDVIRREVLAQLVTTQAVSVELPFFMPEPPGIAAPGMVGVPYEMRPMQDLGEGIRHLQGRVPFTSEFGHSLVLAWLGRNGLQLSRRSNPNTYEQGFLIAELADGSRFRQSQHWIAERLSIPPGRSGPVDNYSLRIEWAWGARRPEQARMPVNIQIVEVLDPQGIRLYQNRSTFEAQQIDF